LWNLAVTYTCTEDVWYQCAQNVGAEDGKNDTMLKKIAS
jgi:hypothetical protein